MPLWKDDLLLECLPRLRSHCYPVGDPLPWIEGGEPLVLLDCNFLQEFERLSVSELRGGVSRILDFPLEKSHPDYVGEAVVGCLLRRRSPLLWVLPENRVARLVGSDFHRLQVPWVFQLLPQFEGRPYCAL